MVVLSDVKTCKMEMLEINGVDSAPQAPKNDYFEVKYDDFWYLEKRSDWGGGDCKIIREYLTGYGVGGWGVRKLML